MAESPTRDPLLLNEDSRGESRALNISLRGWMALLIVVTFCYCAVLSDDPLAAMKDLVLIVIGFYFGTRSPAPAKPNS